MKKVITLASAIAIGVSLNVAYSGGSSNDLVSEYIVQGAKKETILKNIDTVGGIVVHEYSVIEAISVKLSEGQLSELKKINPLLRSFKDKGVKVASAIQSFSSDNMKFNLDKKTATWRGVNSTYGEVALNEIKLSLPKQNKNIRFVKVNGQEVHRGKLKISGNEKLTINLDEDLVLNPGQVVKVVVKFGRLNNTDPSSYNVEFSESNLAHANIDKSADTSVETQSFDKQDLLMNDGDIAGKLKFYLRTNEAQWTVSNILYYDQYVTELNIKYPDENTTLEAISINDVDVSFDSDRNAGLSKLSFYQPVLVAGQEAVRIKAKFSNLSTIYSEDYNLEVKFDSGFTKNIIVPLKSYEQGRERDTNYSTLVRANKAHEVGLTGRGVTVAVIDTGARDLREIKYDTEGDNRDITIVDFTGEAKNAEPFEDSNKLMSFLGGIAQHFNVSSEDVNSFTDQNADKISNVVGAIHERILLWDADTNGHGTHLTSIIANSTHSYDKEGNPTDSYNGIAPDVDLVVVKAFDAEGQSSYLNILQAIEYVLENKDVLNIKVLNLSFSALPSSYYWDDPLNQALMKAWQAGITVVAAAGNRGPDAMTIGVPGNTPYVITVGAVSDNYTPENRNDDFVTTFSSAGPTYEGFVKPEIVAPGGHIQGVMHKSTLIRETFPLYNKVRDGEDAHDYFEMSGSSQSTAVTTGIVALMLQNNPNLSPDDIKCRLMATANAAVGDKGELAFSVFQQGAGLVDAMAAIQSTEVGCANGGLSIERDLSGEEHFIGPVRRYENDGDFYIEGVEGLEWSGAYTDSQLWRNMSFDTESQLWRTMSFNAESQLWRHTNFTSNSQLWRTMSFNAESQLWRNMSFSAESQLWRTMSFDTESQLWRDMSFDAESQLWRNMSFDAESQLWRNMSFNSDSISREWIDHE